MPDVEPELAEVWEVLAAAAVASLPGWARAMYGFGAGGHGIRGSVPPEREAVRQVLGVLDAVYLGEPGVLEARQRLTLRMRAAEPGGTGPARTAHASAAPASTAPVNEPKLRVSRGLTAMRLAARGGARYAANAPRLFAAAGERRQQLRDDLALRTAQDVADTLGTMKGVLMKIGQLASYVDDGLAPPARRVLSRLQDSVPPMSPELAAGVIDAESSARRRSGSSRSGTRCRSRRRRSARCTGPSPPTAGPSRSRCSTRASPRRSPPTWATWPSSGRC